LSSYKNEIKLKEKQSFVESGGCIKVVRSVGSIRATLIPINPGTRLISREEVQERLADPECCDQITTKLRVGGGDLGDAKKHIELARQNSKNAKRPIKKEGA